LILYGVSPLGGVNKGGHMGKTSYFRAKCVNISKTAGESQKLLLMTNRKFRSCICTFDWHQDRWPWM